MMQNKEDDNEVKDTSMNGKQKLVQVNPLPVS